MKKIIVIAFIMIIGLTIQVFSQTLPQGKYVLLEKRQSVTGTLDNPMQINIDFPEYSLNTSTKTLTSHMALNVTDATQVITLESLTISGFGSGRSDYITCFDTLESTDRFTVSTDGSAQYFWNGAWRALSQGQVWSETTTSTIYQGMAGQFTPVTTITNFGIWDKANIVAPTPVPTADPTPGTALCGDINGSGAVDIVDALMVAQYYVGIIATLVMPTAGDVDGNGIVDIVDALRIAQFYVGLISTLSCR
jgi:hypothetical protein